MVSRAGEGRGGGNQNTASIKCENRIQQLLGEKYQVKGTPLRSETAGSQKVSCSEHIGFQEGCETA